MKRLQTPGMRNWRDLNRPLENSHIVPIILAAEVVFILHQLLTQM